VPALAICSGIYIFPASWTGNDQGQTVLDIIFLTGYRHFHLKKGKVKQGFIYENAQKKVLENCIFCPRKSLILLNKKGTTDAYPWQKLTWPMARWAKNSIPTSPFGERGYNYIIVIDMEGNIRIYKLPKAGFIHFFVEQNQGLSRTKNTVFKHLFLSIFIYKTLFNLTSPSLLLYIARLALYKYA
jgi:hypothetical protein